MSIVFEQPQHVRDFLTRLINDTPPLYRDKLSGIVRWLYECGGISPKQLGVIQLNATKLGRTLPNELLQAVGGGTDTRNWPEDSPPAVDTSGVLADLFESIAQAMATAARRLR